MGSSRGNTALLLILHGSPRPAANKPALELAEKLRRRGEFDLIAVAFLECNDPSIPEALEDCAARGMRRVLVVPYFLHSGRHTVLDVPNLLMDAARLYPEMEIVIGDPIGASALLTVALKARAEEQLRG